jgi:ketosteroid isomerase-like protein
MRTARELFDGYQRCLVHKDWQGFGDLLTEAAVMEFPFAPPGVATRREGREVIRAAAREGWARLALQFEPFRAVVVHDGRDPDLVIAEYELCGTVTATGERFQFPAAVVLRGDHGLIASLREYLDLIAIARPTGRAAAIAAYLMTPTSGPTPREIWEAALRCHQQGDLAGYVALFEPDGAMELPFTLPGVPARIAGAAEIERVLSPLWQRSRASGRRTIGYEPKAVHQTCDPDVIIAEFDLLGETGAGERYRLSYVHVVRVRNGRIALLRDYVDARALAERLAGAAPS